MMRGLLQKSIRNSPAMNTLLIAVLAAGAVSMIAMRREVFPQFELEIVLVSVPFPGASPEEVENGICEKIEAAVNSVDGVRKVTSIARESFAFVILELKSNVRNVQRVLNDVRSRVDQISSFPPRAEDPEVQQIIFKATAIQVGVLGPTESSLDPLERRRQLRDLAESIREELLQLPAARPSDPLRALFAPFLLPKGNAISEVNIRAERPYEIAVEVSEDQLQRYGLSLDEVARRLREQNIEMPGGKIEASGSEVLLRGKNKRETGIEIAAIPLISKDDGGSVTVGDLGAVIDGFEETASEHLIDGRPGLVLAVASSGDEDLLTVTDTVRDFVARRKLPPGYELRTWSDISLEVRDRLRMLTQNGAQGLALVFITLAIFLELRLAFWVAMGIPVAILGAALVLITTGNTLNMLTMFAFLMTLGIVVDDAIVIGENIYAHRQRGKPFIASAIDGTYEVIPSVIASVLTTIIAFVPLMFISGVMGKFIAVMPIVVIAMLIVSLAESIFVLPAHLAHEHNLFIWLLSRVLYIFKPLYALSHRVNIAADGGLSRFVNRFYLPIIRWSLDHRSIVVAIGVALLILAGGMVGAGIVPFEPFPSLDGRDISATIAFPDGTPVETTRQATETIEASLRAVDAEIQEEFGASAIATVYRRIGEVGDAFSGPTGITDGGHVASLSVELVAPDQRQITSQAILERWRQKTPPIAGTDVLNFGSRSMGPGGKKIEFKLLAADAANDDLPQATEECKDYLRRKVGVYDVEDDDRPGKWELTLRLNELGQSLGLDEQALADTIRSGFFGAEVMRLQRGRHEVKLMVRYPKAERQSLATLAEVRVRDQQGVERPLNKVATIDFRRAPSEVNRLNGKRSVTISADVKSDEGANAAEIVAQMKADFLPALLAKYERLGAPLFVDWQGDQQETADSISSMLVGFWIAMLAMYVLLTFEFRSYMQPLIIMAIIPFGLVGAVVGHLLMGLDLTLFSMFGLVALTGVVVNDSIVLLDFINHQVDDGVPLDEALVTAGQRRVRPILLTSVTTVAGLFPILLERSFQAQVIIPMATSLIFGLIASTLLVLILVPVLYSIHARAMHRFFPVRDTGDTQFGHRRYILGADAGAALARSTLESPAGAAGQS